MVGVDGSIANPEQSELTMIANQEPLPLGRNADKTGGDAGHAANARKRAKAIPEPAAALQPLLADTVKKLVRAHKVALPISKQKDTAQVTIKDLDRLIAALRVIPPGLSEVEQQREDLHRQRQAAFGRRREDLARAANAAGWSFRRLKNYDYVGCFQVNYRKERVALKLGSEQFTILTELDGRQLFARLQDEKKRLEDFPFDRAGFFRSMKDAIALARSRGLDRNGKAPIRPLYPLFVLARHTEDERFLKRPTSFVEYPMEQFVYDFARFGRRGWKMDNGERLCNEPPNMASVGRGAAITLPSLDGSRAPQLCAIWTGRT